jgi:mannonate dehydratase
MAGSFFMQQSMRWFGEADLVSLSAIRQCGCEAVVTALHQVPVGEVWTIEDIQTRKRLIEQSGLVWEVVESLPVHEDIKRKSGDYQQWIDHYKTSLTNLAKSGIKVVTYNFMPILDWLRTDISYQLPSGARALYFDRIDFIIFDWLILKRPNAENDYMQAELTKAKEKFAPMPADKREQLFSNAMLGLPGSKQAFTSEQILAELELYQHIDASQLKQNLYDFLQQIIPVAEAVGIKMAIHPDDPPYSILGLPRVVSTATDLDELINAVPSLTNGLCFCTGSYGARPDNDLPAMLKKYGERIHFLHLRNTKMVEGGNFYEAGHLGGDTDMFAIVHLVWQLMQERQIALPMRPDHGHEMLDDQQKKNYPGYSAIGRLKGLAELRGLEYAISRMH